MVVVSPTSVRNRIDAFEDVGIVEGDAPQLDYERAGFPLHDRFVCSVATARGRVARDALDIGGVVNVRETLTDDCNLVIAIVIVAVDTTRGGNDETCTIIRGMPLVIGFEERGEEGASDVLTILTRGDGLSPQFTYPRTVRPR